jgi:mycothiol S-conjugate amidase
MDQPLCLLTVHAHPDDEASKGAGTVARARAEGVHTVLVCCTGGEAGDILNPAMDVPEVHAEWPGIRLKELERSAEAIGYDDVILFGYRDSGMPDTEHNAHPECFAQTPVDESTELLVRAIREHRPQVIVTYGDDQRGYPHPDHLRVHDISVLAFDRAGDPEWYPEAGEPWQPSKLYYSTWSKARILAMHERFVALGLESPYTPESFERPDQDHRVTTRVDISAHHDARRLALLAHATQIDPESPFWFGLPAEEAARAYPWDDYILARSLVDTEPPEDDLFAGLRDPVGS